MPRPLRLAALLSHPIQYMVPLLKRLAAVPEIDLSVFFMTETGMKPTKLETIGEALVWDIPLLEGYKSKFLRNVSPKPNTYSVLSKVNPEFVVELARGRFDALYLHGYASVTELVALAEAKALGIPVLFHGDTNLVSETERPRSLRNLFRRAFSSQIDAALVMSTRAKQFYLANGVPEERLFWAPLAVDNDSFIEKHEKLKPRRDEIRARLGLAPELPVIVTVINFRPSKRPFDLLEAHARRDDRQSLLMVGTGPLLEECRELVARRGIKNVHLPGPKNQTELPEFYTAADVFALPSIYDLNPLVVREAMCFSLPLVLSDGVQSSIDFLREGENGHGFPKTDVDGLTRALDDVLAHPEHTRRMGAASLELIKPWNHDVSVEAILTALRAVVPNAA